MSPESASPENIFDKAIAFASAEDRTAYLDRACGDDLPLRNKVEKLVENHFRSGSFLEKPAIQFGQTVDLPASERIGSMVGPYKLREQIGEGGMGVVYLAEQTEPVRRRVALKIIKPGMDTRQVIARFEAERQALAMMDHPNIARILDAGTIGEENRSEEEKSSENNGHPSPVAPSRPSLASTARPYFVMELVRGLPITEYCDQARLNPRQRLELFLNVCQAVQHAHQKGIIHRDLKPSNVMVTLHDGTPVVKVIDFGIAKALHQQLSPHTIYTAFSELVGTPLYMSPEQAEMSALDIDTRSDVYSLGVLLYELLTGHTPFDKEILKNAGFDEMRRIIREDEPPRPSQRISTLNADALSTISKSRGIDERRLQQSLHGELDWIVMKALEKDRNRRYESASSLAADILRYLSDEPVQACPPSATYRLSKFAQRNKVALVTSGVVTGLVLTVLLLGGGTLWFQERQRAATAQAVADDLQAAEIWQRQERWPETLQALERATGRLEGSGLAELQAQVDTRRREVALVSRLENVWLTAGFLSNIPDYASADLAYAAAFAEHGLDMGEADAEKSARTIRASAIRTRLITALDHWAFAKEQLPGGNAEPLRAVAQLADDDPWRRRLRDTSLRKDPAALIRLAKDDDVFVQPPTNLLILSILLAKAKARAAELQLLRKAQELHPGDFWINNRLAMRLLEHSYNVIGITFGDFGEQVSHLSERQVVEQSATAADAVGFLRAALAIRPQSAEVYSNLGIALKKQQKLPEAVATLRKAIELKPDYAEAYTNLGNVLKHQHKLPEAESAHRKAIELKPDYAEAYTNLGNVLEHQHKLSEAESAHRKALEVKPNFAQSHFAYNNLGNVLQAREKLPEAAEAYRKAIEFKPDFAKSYTDLGKVLYSQHKLSEAVEAYHKALEFTPEDPIAYNGLGIVLVAQQKLPEAVEAYRKAIELQPDFVYAYVNLGSSLRAQQKVSEAIDAYRKAIELKPDFAGAYYGLGITLTYQKKLPEAIEAYCKAIELQPDYAEAYTNLGSILRSQQKLPEAVAAFRKAVEVKPNFAEAHIAYNNLGDALKHQQMLPEAIEAYRKAIELKSDSAVVSAAYISLGDVLTDQEKWQEAVEAYREVINLAPKAGLVHCKLGKALLRVGKFDEALASFKRGHEVGARNRDGTDPTTTLIRQAEEFVRLDAQLPMLLKGESQPAAEDRVALAELCRLPCRQFYAAAARFYEEAFTVDPNLSPEVRYNAACVAALAGRGLGKDAAELDAKEYSRLRGQALAWLQDELKAWRSKLENERDKALPAVRQQMQHWQQDQDLDGVRSAAALAKLPEAERQEWQQLWKEVATLMGN